MKSNMAGLTLIEVLIALAIIGISLTAVIKVTTQNIRATTYLENKTIALWVAKKVMNEARLSILKMPEPGGTLKKQQTMLGKDWYWQLSLNSTPNARINKITVQVYEHEPDEEDEGGALVSLESYQYSQRGALLGLSDEGL